jgi:hypothetical protein
VPGTDALGYMAFETDLNGKLKYLKNDMFEGRNLIRKAYRGH